MRLTIVVPLLTGIFLSTHLMAADVIKFRDSRKHDLCKGGAEVRGLTGDAYTKYIDECMKK